MIRIKHNGKIYSIEDFELLVGKDIIERFLRRFHNMYPQELVDTLIKKGNYFTLNEEIDNFTVTISPVDSILPL